MNAPQQVKVWDPLVKIFHWALVLTFFTAYLIEDERLTLHVWAGYTVSERGRFFAPSLLQRGRAGEGVFKAMVRPKLQVPNGIWFRMFEQLYQGANGSSCWIGLIVLSTGESRWMPRPTTSGTTRREVDG